MGTVKWRLHLTVDLPARCCSRPGPNNIDMHLTEPLPYTCARGLSLCSKRTLPYTCARELCSEDLLHKCGAPCEAPRQLSLILSGETALKFHRPVKEDLPFLHILHFESLCEFCLPMLENRERRQTFFPSDRLGSGSGLNIGRHISLNASSRSYKKGRN